MLVSTVPVDESRNSGNIFWILSVINMEKMLHSTCFCIHLEIKSFLVTFDSFKNASCIGPMITMAITNVNHYKSLVVLLSMFIKMSTISLSSINLNEATVGLGVW